MLRLIKSKVISFAGTATLLLPAALAQDTSITIRALDGKSGKPLIHQRLVIFGGKTAEAPRFHDTHFDISTDNAGFANLNFDATETQWLNVFADFMTVCYKKPNFNSFSLSLILDKGVIAPNNCGAALQTAKPGVLIIFARQRTLRER